MKLNIPTPQVESAGLISEHLFSVGDASIIFDILRNKIYSNPVEAVVREISCNARDAHREVGKFDLPIKIYLPNTFSPEFRIQDFGPGISPERMEQVYTRYGNSTKREDNIQTGSFGLEAKSFFALTNSASIITVTNHKKRTYCAFIDETRVGKIALTSEVPTDEGNGTTIVIPVKREQVRQFEDAVYYFTQFWNVKPEIIGATLPPLPETILECPQGKWVKNCKYNQYNSLIALIDGIPYHIGNQSKILNYIAGQAICVNFEIGELSISASRDSLQENEETLKIIEEKVRACEKEIIKLLNDKITQCPTYKSAVEFLTPLRKFIGNFNPMWKDLIVYDFNTALSRHQGQRISIYKKHGEGKMSRQDKEIKVGINIRTVINETGSSLSVKKIKKELENHPEVERLQIITYLYNLSGKNKNGHESKLKLIREALEIFVDGKILAPINKPAAKKKIPKKPKLIYSYLTNENKTNLVKSSFDYTAPQIYCPYDSSDNSVYIGSSFQVNSYKRLQQFLSIESF